MCRRNRQRSFHRETPWWHAAVSVSKARRGNALPLPFPWEKREKGRGKGRGCGVGKGGKGVAKGVYGEYVCLPSLPCMVLPFEREAFFTGHASLHLEVLKVGGHAGRARVIIGIIERHAHAV